MNAPLKTTAEAATDFARRHIGPSPRDIAAMLDSVGAKSLTELMGQTLPSSIRQKAPLDLGRALSETEALAHMRELAAQNEVFTSLIGQGYSGTILPAVIQRNILENPAWYTAYTPYQPEISQGRLEALFNFQTMICDLTGLDVANASLLDEGTAAAEAMALAERASPVKAKSFFVDARVHPQTLAVLRTRAEPLGWNLVVGDPLTDLASADVFGGLLQYPDTSGAVRDLRPAIAALRAKGALAVIAADLLALTLIASPGELGADIAVGSAQRFGVPMGYGGPHAAYMSVRDALKRSLPGRIVGLSVDSRGQPAYRLALQTREQHIRREKATSNICTAQVLLAVIASMYAVYHGPEGLTHIARTVHRRAVVLAAGLAKLGFAPKSQAFFDTVTVATGSKQDEIIARALAEKINLRIGDGTLGIAVDETTTPATVEAVWRAFGGKLSYADVEAGARETLPADLKRGSAFLTHPVFHTHRSETELLRYMRKLADRDLALDRAMIPLGSCTMKLNATTEMIPLTWPEFGNLHPFAPCEPGARLSRAVCPARKMAVRHHRLRRDLAAAEFRRAGRICRAARDPRLSRGARRAAPQGVPDPLLRARHQSGLRPYGRHGGGGDGLRCARRRRRRRSPRQGGEAFEKSRRRHDHLSLDAWRVRGAHPRYLRHRSRPWRTGLSRRRQPERAGRAVAARRLRRRRLAISICTRPSASRTAAAARAWARSASRRTLRPILPGHPATDGDAPHPVGPVSAAPFGSASILTISYIYILMMGGEGLTRATEVAILNANYIASRLDPHFPVLYKNAKGRVAHECIVDPRPLKATSGVTVDDIAKRLIDYGFHAPTMSFPVPGTLMIEPTESESKAELDRFCDAMIAIRSEIAEIEIGRWKVEASPLRHAPHTVHDIADDAWSRAYSRAEGCFPGGTSRTDKYWCPVGRVDNVYGDRNLVCSCPPVEDYAQAAE